jgi:hypothetical protein
VLSGKDDWLSDEQKIEVINGTDMKEQRSVLFIILVEFYFVMQFDKENVHCSVLHSKAGVAHSV